MLNKCDISAIIVAAGKQTRFKDTISKALYPFNDSNITKINYDHLSKYADKVYIIASTENYNEFKNNELVGNYNIIAINSGYGCGDAVYKAIKNIKTKWTILIWGDSIQDNDKLYNEVILNIIVKNV